MSFYFCAAIYHHRYDQLWYDRFSKLFASRYDILTDTSLERRIDSEDADYTRRSIRENNLAGSSLTIILCGPRAWGRRWIDWEIQMTLNKQHALLGIIIPSNAARRDGSYLVPPRLRDNVISGFAHCIFWTGDVTQITAAMCHARQLSRHARNVSNSRPSMRRSRS